MAPRYQVQHHPTAEAARAHRGYRGDLVICDAPGEELFAGLARPDGPPLQLPAERVTVEHHLYQPRTP